MSISCLNGVQVVTPTKTIDLRNIAESSLAANSVTIGWDIVDTANGDAPITADGFLKYGTSNPPTTDWLPGEASRDTYSTHAQTLTGLTANTEYFYTITSTVEDGRTCTSPVRSFTTPQVTSKQFPTQVNSAFPPEYPSIALPTAQGATTFDSSAGTTIRKLVDGTRHAYSRRLALNTDSTRYMSDDGAIRTYPGLALIHDMQNAPSVSNSEHVWSLSDPDIIYGCSNNILVVYNVATNTVINTGIPAQTFGPFEGSPSTNDRIVANQGGTMRVVDLSNPNAPVVMGTLPEPAGLDAVAISKFGNFVVADVGNTNIVYTPQLAQLRTIPFGLHSDTAIDDQGREVFVLPTGSTSLQVFVLSDNTGNSDYVLPFGNINGASHFSGNAVDRPGWLYGSFNVDFGNADGDTSAGFIGAVKLSPGETVYEVWSSNYYRDHTYINTPKASVNKSGDTIVFTTPLGGTSTDYSVTCNQ